jgi:3-hydroxyacyl-[acyl-carrier-protein] dehydratase
METIEGLYTISKLSQPEENKVEAIVDINPDHDVFKGHFPTQPVLPGVVMIDILNDCLSAALKSKYRMTTAAQIKYLNVVVPTESKQLRVEIDIKRREKGLDANCTSYINGDTAHFKLKGSFEN